MDERRVSDSPGKASREPMKAERRLAGVVGVASPGWMRAGKDNTYSDLQHPGVTAAGAVWVFASLVSSLMLARCCKWLTSVNIEEKDGADSFIEYNSDLAKFSATS